MNRHMLTRRRYLFYTIFGIACAVIALAAYSEIASIFHL